MRLAVVLLLLIGGVCVALEHGGLRSLILLNARGVVVYDARDVRVGTLVGVRSRNPTALAFGPDDRLYVAEQRGRIYAYTLNRLALGEYEVSRVEVIEELQRIPNHNDDGEPQPSLDRRLLTGMLITGRADRPVIYAATSDPRIEDPDVDTNSGVVSRLTRGGASWRREDLVRGLPRSRTDHAPNGLWLDEDSRVLYLTVGGNTNSGAPSDHFDTLSEYALSASILEIDLDGLPGIPYDLPTLDDEDRPGPQDSNDPFGGNGGKNQAILSEQGPVRLYASGLRNAYRLVRVAGAFYTIDNGPNQYLGGPPVWRSERVTNEVSEESERLPNVLLRIAKRGYYGGHPNPTRADRRNTFNDSDPQTPVLRARSGEAHFVPPGKKAGELMQFRQSVNGLVPYQSAGLGEESRGCLLAAGWDGMVRLICVSKTGDVTKEKVLARTRGYMPLDITAQPDDGVFPGSIWAADHGSSVIMVIDPVRESGPSVQLAGFWRDLVTYAAELAIWWLSPASRVPLS